MGFGMLHFGLCSNESVKFSRNGLERRHGVTAIRGVKQPRAAAKVHGSVPIKLCL